MEVTARSRGGVKCEGRPHDRLRRVFEPARHHADDCSRAAVDLYLAPHYARIRAEALLPRIEAQDDDAIAARLIFFASNHAAEHRSHLQRLEESGIANRAQVALWFAVARGQVESGLLVRADIG